MVGPMTVHVGENTIRPPRGSTAKVDRELELGKNTKRRKK